MYPKVQPVAVVLLLISFFWQGCNLAANLDTSPQTSNLPKVAIEAQYRQASTSLTTIQSDQATMSPACALGLMLSSHVFTTFSGEKLKFLQENGIWQAKLLPVMCEHQEEILMRVYCLSQQKSAIHKHSIYLLPTPFGSQCIFLGKLGLLGGMEASSEPVRLAFHEAVKQGDLALIENLLASGADPNSLDTQGVAPIEYAIWRGYLEIVSLLLENGANPNLPTSSNSSYLHLAAMKNYVAIAKILVEAGADVNARTKVNNMSCTPLDLAINLGDEDMVQLLLKNGANPNRINANGFTPLHWAAENGHVGIIDMLLAEGADLAAVTYDGFTPLHIAVSQKDFVLTKLLLARGADPNMVTESGVTLLHWAVENDHLDLVNLLLEKGAKLDIKDHKSWTPLHVAADQGHLEVILRLLAYKPDLNIQNNYGESFLHVLLDNSNIKDDKKRWPTALAVIDFLESTQHTLLNQLLEIMHDCCLELTNENTRTILAMMVDYVQGLDINLKNQDEKTVLDVIELQLAEEAAHQAIKEVSKSLKRHQKLGGWMALAKYKRAVRQSTISNAYAIEESNLKKPRNK